MSDADNDDEPDVAASHEGARPTIWQRNLSRRWLLAILPMAVVLLAAAGTQLPSSRLAIASGPAPWIAVDGDLPDRGFSQRRWVFTTAEVTRLSLTSSVIAGLRGDKTEYSPVGPDADADAAVQGQVEMASSKKAAFAAAGVLRGRAPDKLLVVVSSVDADGPAGAAGVRVGDRLATIDGVEMASTADIIASVEASGGSEITLGLVGGAGQRSERTVRAVRRDGRWKLGVTLTAAVADASPEWKIDSAGVGGPSAGLMFTLAYLDAGAEGDLSGGRVIAGTGTIDSAGTVGAVGAVGLKVAGARRAGAVVFFVPASEYQQAADAAGGVIDVVAVSSAADALGWLCAHGGTDPLCSAEPAEHQVRMNGKDG